MPKGAVTGGRFTVTTRIEPALALAKPEPAGVDEFGFPVVRCARCQGRGLHGTNTNDGDRCYGRQGTGHTYAPEVLRDQRDTEGFRQVERGVGFLQPRGCVRGVSQPSDGRSRHSRWLLAQHV